MYGNSYRECTHVALRNYTCDIKSTFIYAYLYKDESYVIFQQGHTMWAKVQRVLQERDGVIYYILYIKWKGSAQFHLKSIRIQLTYYNYMEIKIMKPPKTVSLLFTKKTVVLILEINQSIPGSTSHTTIFSKVTIIYFE